MQKQIISSLNFSIIFQIAFKSSQKDLLRVIEDFLRVVGEGWCNFQKHFSFVFVVNFFFTHVLQIMCSNLKFSTLKLIELKNILLYFST